jgi:hypothetical protein
LSGSFRGAVREGQAGHGRKHAKNRCNILDHFIFYLLFVFVFVFELEPSRYFVRLNSNFTRLFFRKLRNRQDLSSLSASPKLVCGLS